LGFGVFGEGGSGFADGLGDDSGTAGGIEGETGGGGVC
jgi:hypothetical protein